MRSTSQHLALKIMDFKGLWWLQPQQYGRREVIVRGHFASYCSVISESQHILLKDCFILKTEETFFYQKDNINQHVCIGREKKPVFGLPQSCLQCETACNFNIQIQA